MSGGTFDYQQFRLQDIAERIQEEIDHNHIRPEWCSADDWNGQKWTDKTIAEFRKAIKLLYKAQVYAHRIDWLLAGDDGEDTFHERLKEDLEKNNDN